MGEEEKKKQPDVAKVASTGKIIYRVGKIFATLPLPAKIVVIVFFAVVLAIIVISLIFQIIFTDLGFTDADDFATTEYAVETDNVIAGLPTFFVKEENGRTSIINSGSIDDALNAEEGEEETQISTEYENVINNVEENGNTKCTVDSISSALQNEIATDIQNDKTGKGISLAKDRAAKDRRINLSAEQNTFQKDVNTEEGKKAEEYANADANRTFLSCSISDVSFNTSDLKIDDIRMENIDTSNVSALTSQLSGDNDVFRSNASQSSFLQYQKNVTNVNLASSFWRGGATYDSAWYDRESDDPSKRIPYIDCFTIILQNKGSTDIISNIENQNYDSVNDVTEYLSKQVQDYNWFAHNYSENINSARNITVKAPVKAPYSYDLTINYKVTVTYKVKKTKEEYELDENGKKKKDEKGNYIKKTVEYEENETKTVDRELTKTVANDNFEYIPTYDYSLTDVDENYDIILSPQIFETKSVTQNQNFQKVEDEASMQKAVDLLQSLTEGDYKDFALGLIGVSADKVRDKFADIAHSFNKKFSFRKYIYSNNTLGGAEGGAFTGNGDEQSIYVYFRQQGYSHAGACAILGNLKTENDSFNPNSGSSHYGIAQWDKGRQANLIQFCNDKGLDYTTLAGQLQFIVYELGQRNSDLNEYLKTATDAKLATHEFAVIYEGCIGATGREDAVYEGTMRPKMVGKTYQALGKRVRLATNYASTFIQYSEDFSSLLGNGDVVSVAVSHVGQHYVWGGNSYCSNWSDRVGIDCSHFVRKVLIDAGVWNESVPYNSTSSMMSYINNGYATYIGTNYADAQPGDILLFSGHTGIYIGNNQMCHAGSKSTGINIKSLSGYDKSCKAILRPIKQ